MGWVLYIQYSIQPMPHFDPYGNPRPCVGCEHFAAFRSGGSIVLCMYGIARKSTPSRRRGMV